MNAVPQLTRTEFGILRGLASGLRLREITDVITRQDNLSATRVKQLAARLYHKFGHHTPTGAVVAAIKAGVLPCPCPTHTALRQHHTPPTRSEGTTT